MRWNDFVDTKATAELERLTVLEEIFDPFSVRNLDRLGIAPGWQCLEVGAGAGSIARRMGELAGPGNVVATDLSTDYLAPLAESGITVLRHDVTVDDQPGEFDLIHCRFVLDHLPERDDTVKRMASWLKPGGALLVESGTTAPELSSHPAVRRAMEALNLVLSQSIGTHTTWARTLPIPLEAAGLIDCRAEGQILPATGGSALARWLISTHKMIERPAIDSGVITQEQLDEAFASYLSPSFVDYTWITVGAWGRRT
jgi:2-polyprenyl-3-methyl-5-hydroxy-6-metoxy-1,4-benzoquinol methylase